MTASEAFEDAELMASKIAPIKYSIAQNIIGSMYITVVKLEKVE